MEYRERPTVTSNYTKQDLTKYAYYRKSVEVENIKNILNDKKVIHGDISSEEHEEYRDPLCFAKQIVIHVQLSTGGDGDGFKFTFSDEKELLFGVYYWADWGVYEEVTLSDDELELVDNLYCVSDWIMGI